MKLNPTKCSLLQTQVRYIGHVVSGIATNPEEVEAVRLWASSAKDVVM